MRVVFRHGGRSFPLGFGPHRTQAGNISDRTIMAAQQTFSLRIWYLIQYCSSRAAIDTSTRRAFCYETLCRFVFRTVKCNIEVTNTGVQVCGYVAASDMTTCAARRTPAVFMRILVTSLAPRSWWLPIPRLLQILG